MCLLLVSCADFEVILTPFSEVIWNRYFQITSLKGVKSNPLHHVWQREISQAWKAKWAVFKIKCFGCKQATGNYSRRWTIREPVDNNT